MLATLGRPGTLHSTGCFTCKLLSHSTRRGEARWCACKSKYMILSRQFLLPVVFANESSSQQHFISCLQSVKVHLTDTAAQWHRFLYTTCSALLVLSLTRQCLLPQDISGNRAILYCEADEGRTGSTKLPTSHAQRPSIIFNHCGGISLQLQLLLIGLQIVSQKVGSFKPRPA